MWITLLGMSTSLASGALIDPIAAIGPTFASAPRTCTVLQAAYTAAIKYNAAAYPTDVRAAWHIMDVTRLTREYRSEIGLTPSEFKAVSGRQNSYHDLGFKPNCPWKGIPGPAKDEEGHSTHVTFSSPVFSDDHHLAVIETSFLEEGTSGYGFICVARLAHGTWSARCASSWIT
jgi:hypothetical protein